MVVVVALFLLFEGQCLNTDVFFLYVHVIQANCTKLKYIFSFHFACDVRQIFPHGTNKWNVLTALVHRKWFSICWSRMTQSSTGVTQSCNCFTPWPPICPPVLLVNRWVARSCFVWSFCWVVWLLFTSFCCDTFLTCLKYRSLCNNQYWAVWPGMAKALVLQFSWKLQIMDHDKGHTLHGCIKHWTLPTHITFNFGARRACR